MEQEEFFKRCGEILRKAQGIESHLESIILFYFCYPGNDNASLLRESILNRINFRGKIEILEEIRKKEEIELKPDLIKSIDFLRDTRNRVAHHEAFAIGQGGAIEFKRFRKGIEDGLELDDDLMNKVEEKRSLAYDGLSQFNSELLIRLNKRFNELVRPTNQKWE